MGARTCASLALAICVAAMVLASVAVSGEAEGWVAPQAPPAPGFPVKVALVLPLSGGDPVQSYGERTRNGALLAINEARAAGWDIQTVVADSACDAAAAADAANQVILTDTVKYIVGAVCSSASIPISEIAEANHVLQISPTSTSPQVTKYADGTNKEYVFRALYLDPFQGQAMAVVARGLGATTAAAMYDEGNPYVRDLAVYFKIYFERMGGTVPVFESYTQDTYDFSGVLGEVRTANPDVLFMPDYFGKVNEIAEQAEAAGVEATFLGADGWDSPDLRRDLLEGAYFSNHFWPGDPRQVVVDFVETYSTTYGTQPDALAALGYDATGVLLQAIAEAGVDDPSVVKDEMAGIAYEGVTDKITFDQFGDPIKGAAVMRIEGGQAALFKWVAPISQLSVVNDGPTDWPQTTTLTATVATGSDVTYAWALGDGSTASGQVVTHTYPTPGDFTAVVTASNWFNSATVTSTVQVVGYRVFLPLVTREVASWRFR